MIGWIKKQVFQKCHESFYWGEERPSLSYHDLLYQGQVVHLTIRHAMEPWRMCQKGGTPPERLLQYNFIHNQTSMD